MRLLPLFCLNYGSRLWKSNDSIFELVFPLGSGRMDQEKKTLKPWIKTLSSTSKGNAPGPSRRSESVSDTALCPGK